MTSTWALFKNIFGQKQHAQVECWFCQTVTTVPIGNKKCFVCPECEQYNGFTEDGDYNKPIPAQYSEELNKARSTPRPRQGGGRAGETTSPLCSVCQVNQELKIQQLAAFKPTHQKNFDTEVTEYSRYLEDAYRLCPACDSKVCAVLGRQDRDIHSKLLGQRLNQAMLSSGMPVQHLQNGSRTVANLRVLAVLIASLVVAVDLSSVLCDIEFDSESSSVLYQKVVDFVAGIPDYRMQLSLIGLAAGILSSLFAGKYRLRYLDCLCPLLWMVYVGCISTPRSSSSSLHLLLESVLPWQSANLLPLLLSSCAWMSCAVHAVQARAKTTKKVFTNRISKSPVSTPSGERSFEDDLGTPQHPPSTQGTPTLAPSLGDSLQGESGEIKRILLDQDLGGLSLGPPELSRPKNKDIWTAHTPPTSRPATPLSEERPPSRDYFRPVISPATFNPLGFKRSPSQSSFVSSFSAGLGPAQPREYRMTSARERLTESGRGSSIPSLAGDISDDSLPLGMSAKVQVSNAAVPVKNRPHMPEWISFLLPCLLGFSLGINCAAALYFMYGR